MFMGQFCAPPLRWSRPVLHYQGRAGQRTKPVILTLPAGMAFFCGQRARVRSETDTFWSNVLGRLFHMNR